MESSIELCVFLLQAAVLAEDGVTEEVVATTISVEAVEATEIDRIECKGDGVATLVPALQAAAGAQMRLNTNSIISRTPEQHFSVVVVVVQISTRIPTPTTKTRITMLVITKTMAFLVSIMDITTEVEAHTKTSIEAVEAAVGDAVVEDAFRKLLRCKRFSL